MKESKRVKERKNEKERINERKKYRIIYREGQRGERGKKKVQEQRGKVIRKKRKRQIERREVREE